MEITKRKKHGSEETYWGDGRIKISRTWKNGKLHGLETLYDVGSARIRINTNWKDGKRFVTGLTFKSEQFWEKGTLSRSTSIHFYKK
ncbi:MORN repeat-containing protein [Cannes 8 virus]|nr:MORN repeat-containing protein [Cannes 8 virus]AVR52739.1 MORN repeat-containing protein [Marseillevirus Shanghai 1]